MVLSVTDLPPALGPETTMMRFWASKVMSSGLIFLPIFTSDSSNIGCLAARHSTWGVA